MYEWTREELVKSFDEDLDMTKPAYELYGATFYPSDILKAINPEMYRGKLNEYIDYLIEIEGIFPHSDGKYYSQPELEEAP